LPMLQRDHFDRMLERLGMAHSDRELENTFYSALRGNALYLKLAAQELVARGIPPTPEELLRRLSLRFGEQGSLDRREKTLGRAAKDQPICGSLAGKNPVVNMRSGRNTMTTWGLPASSFARRTPASPGIYL